MLQLEVVKRYSGVHQILGRLRSRDVVQDSAIFEDPFTDEIFHVTTSGENEAVYTIGSLYFVIGMKVGQHDHLGVPKLQASVIASAKGINLELYRKAYSLLHKENITEVILLD